MRFAPITGLFGTNSSGKTSILQWLLLMKQTVNSSDRQQVLNLGDDKDPVRLGTFRDIVFRHDLSSSISWLLTWTLPGQLKVLDPDKKKAVLFEGDSMAFASKVGASLNQTFVQDMRYQFAGHDFHYRPKPSTSQKKREGYALSVAGPSEFKFKRSLGRAWDLPGPVKCYGFPDQVNSYFQNAGFLTDFQLAFEELFNRVYYLGPLRSTHVDSIHGEAHNRRIWGSVEKKLLTRCYLPGRVGKRFARQGKTQVFGRGIYRLLAEGTGTDRRFQRRAGREGQQHLSGEGKENCGVFARTDYRRRVWDFADSSRNCTVLLRAARLNGGAGTTGNSSSSVRSIGDRRRFH